MKVLGKKLTKRLKLVGLTAASIFSLASVFTATMAWFSANMSVEATGMQISALNISGSSVDSVKLIKFDFAKDTYVINGQTITIVDYINPSRGSVNGYMYDKEEKAYGYDQEASPCEAVLTSDHNIVEGKVYFTKSAEADSEKVGVGGYLVDNNGYSYTAVETPSAGSLGSYYELSSLGNDGGWVPVDAMNVYDPIEKLIRGNSFNLSELHCNAIYEVTLSSPDLANNCNLSVTAKTFTPIGMTEDDVLLSDVVDFDIFFESDLQAGDDTDEEIYERISTLADNIDPHRNFYSAAEKPANLELLTTAQKAQTYTSNENTLKVYVNINYAPDEIDKYAKRIQSFSANIQALYDFTIDFDVVPAE